MCAANPSLATPYAPAAQDLPAGCSDFAELRAKHLLYADNTRQLYGITVTHSLQLLVRPPRFGKTLLLSALKELFEHGVRPYDGHDSYFKGLAIEKRWKEEKTYPVLQLDLKDLCQDWQGPEHLDLLLQQQVKQFAERIGIDTGKLFRPQDKFYGKFEALLNKLPLQSVVILADNYDAPLTACLLKRRGQQEFKETARLLYGFEHAIKINLAQVRCALLTATIHYPQENLFRGIIPDNISWDSDLGDICGFTREQIQETFGRHLTAAAARHFALPAEQVQAEHQEQMLNLLERHCGGYRFAFAYDIRVFSPEAVLQFFAGRHQLTSVQPEVKNMPPLLHKRLQRITAEKLHQLMQLSLPGHSCFGALLETIPSLPKLLFYYGYLTMKEYDDGALGMSMVCPNEDKRQFMAGLPAVCRKGAKRMQRFCAFSEQTVHTDPRQMIVSTSAAQDLPAGCSDFAELRAKHLLYADNTRLIYELASLQLLRQLVRPPRFGKTLLLSALKELFEHGVRPYDGHDSWFKGLAIEKLWTEEQTYPVLQLDFKDLCQNWQGPEHLDLLLQQQVKQFAERLGLDTRTIFKDKDSFFWQFMALLQALPYRGIVILADNYDAPLTACLLQENKQDFRKTAELLYFFEYAMQSNMERVRFACLTATVCYPNDNDTLHGFIPDNVSWDKGFGAICGFTREQIQETFGRHLTAAAARHFALQAEQVQAEHKEQMLNLLQRHCGGYCFARCNNTQVFSPDTVLQFFAGGYQFRTELPEQNSVPPLLYQYLQRKPAETLQLLGRSDNDLAISLLELVPSLPALLFFYGYLTMHEYQDNCQSIALVCPNSSSRQFMTVLQALCHKLAQK